MFVIKGKSPLFLAVLLCSFEQNCASSVIPNYPSTDVVNVSDSIQEPDIRDGSVPDIVDAGPRLRPLISAGDWHSCATRGDERVYCWGTHTPGQTPRLQAEFVAEFPSRITALVSGRASCALLADGTVWCWGDINATEGPTVAVTQLEGIRNAVTLDTNYLRTAVVLSDGTLRRFGRVGGISDTNVQHIGMGYIEECVTFRDGRSRCGFPQREQRLAFTGVVAADITAYLACALSSDGFVQCSLRSEGVWSMPTRINNLDNIVELSVGTDTACVRRNNGVVYCKQQDLMFAPMSGLPLATSISVGFSHGCAIGEDATAWCWGNNNLGQLGDGTNTDRATPVRVLGF